MRINTKEKKKRISEDVNTSTRLQKHNNTLSYCNLTNVSIEYLFRLVIFLITPKARRSSYTMAFMIKVIAEAVENSSEIARDYGLSEAMCDAGDETRRQFFLESLRCVQNVQKWGRFTPKSPKLDKQTMEWFSQQRDQIFLL